MKSLTRLFASRLIAWQKKHGRHDLPWQLTADPYRIWLSEIMLQQTQVASVIPYYERFLASYPSLRNLAEAPVEDVMGLWSGLGYYARARNLHRCAQIVLEQHDGEFPGQPEQLRQLPGIGRSTANAIAVFCHGAHAPILDGNVKRVLCRAFGIEGFPGKIEVEDRLWMLAESLFPSAEGAIYIQAQMDLGASICTRNVPQCLTDVSRCPLSDLCVARCTGRVADLPARRPRKPLSQRWSRMLLVVDGSRVLLKRRPPSGIWGGLLSLPEIAEDDDPASHAMRALGCELGQIVSLPPLKHGFTHFQLTITPLVADVVRHVHLSDSAGYCWLERDAIEAAALPTPIRKILTTYFKRSSG